MSALFFRRQAGTEYRGESGGFTVIELIAVLTILGILAAAIGPDVWRNTAFYDMGYADELASAMRYSQKIAAATQCEVRLDVTLAGYSAAQPTAAGNKCSSPASGWAVPVLLPDGRTVAGQSPSSGSGVSSAAQILFDGRGALASSSGLPIQIGTRQINVAAGGLIQVQ